MKVICICLICFFPNSLLAKNRIWIKSIYTPYQEFQAFLNSTSEFDLSYAEQQVNRHRAYAKRFQLKQKLLKAQQFYLEGKGDLANRLFLQLSHLAYKADWDTKDRRILLYSFLRLAQKEQEKEKRQAYLLLVNDFSGFKINAKNYLDFDLFPPPLMEELKQIQQRNNTLVMNWNFVFPDHEIVLLNGEQINKNQKLKYPQAYYRVTALSSSHQAWSQTVNLSKLISQTVKTKSLSEGTCEQLKIIKAHRLKKLFLFPVTNCPDLNVLNLDSKKRDPKLELENSNQKNLDSAKEKQKLSNSNPRDRDPFFEREESKDTDKFKAIVSKLPAWLIIGVGVVVLVLVLSLSDTEDSEEQQSYIY